MARLLEAVDAALARMDGGTYGLCEVCRDPVESDRLLADPLEQFCLDHLPPAAARALEADMALAAYTDGLSEAPDIFGNEFGRAPVESIIANTEGLPAEAVLGAVLAAWRAHRAGAPRADDLAVLVLRRLP